MKGVQFRSPNAMLPGTLGRETDQLILAIGLLRESPALMCHLLWRMACSTLDVFSCRPKSTECWLMTDRNLRISLVLSVFPAPLSPLKDKTHKFWFVKKDVFLKQLALPKALIP